MHKTLEGVRVVDLTRYMAGPFSTMILADLGAEVILIEPPGGRIAATRPYRGNDTYFYTCNRGKKSVVLDLKQQVGKRVFLDLVAHADVVVDNFRPGVAERLGIGYDTLKEINPRIIGCSITAFSRTSPYRDRPAFDLILQARAGLLSITGHPGGPPVAEGAPIADITTPMWATHGILAALYEREKTGQGQKVEANMLFCQIALLALQGPDYFNHGIISGPIGGGQGIPANPPYGTYRTSDGYISLCAHRAYEKFCKAIGREELLIDPRFETMQKRQQNKAELNALMDEMFVTRTTAEWEKLLTDGDVPVGPVNNIAQAFAEPEVAEQMTAKVPFDGEDVTILGCPIAFSSTPEEIRRHFNSPPTYGEHTEDVLSQVLGYSSDKVATLKKEGVVS